MTGSYWPPNFQLYHDYHGYPVLRETDLKRLTASSSLSFVNSVYVSLFCFHPFGHRLLHNFIHWFISSPVLFQYVCCSWALIYTISFRMQIYCIIAVTCDYSHNVSTSFTRVNSTYFSKYGEIMYRDFDNFFKHGT